VNPWLPYRVAKPHARLRMFCFPYAGGGASIYRSWSTFLPPDVEVCAIQMPGRESRVREQLFNRYRPMTVALADALGPFLDLPFVFFGHSLGALISFELARELRRRGQTLPLHLFVSGRGAPDLPLREAPIHALPEPEFIAELRRLNGTPEAVLQHEELMRLVLPILRADFSVNETYVYTGEEPLDLGISALGGLGDDDVTREDLQAWRQQARGSFRMRMFQGDHFFIHSTQNLLLEAVARDLAEVTTAVLASLR
jgi:medium-chain acyl-[acyl-carrier-protein] hydrolase